MEVTYGEPLNVMVANTMTCVEKVRPNGTSYWVVMGNLNLHQAGVNTWLRQLACLSLWFDRACIVATLGIACSFIWTTQPHITAHLVWGCIMIGLVLAAIDRLRFINE